MPENTHPIPIHRTISRKKIIGQFLLVALAIALLQIVPLLTDPQHFWHDLLHGIRLPAILGAMILVVCLGLLFAKSSTLRVDEQGIDLRTGAHNYFYNWPDIADVRPVKGGVQLDVRGRSEARNRYNVLTARFGIPSRDLVKLVRDSMDRFGHQDPRMPILEARTRPTVTPADNAVGLSTGSAKRVGMALLLLFVAASALLSAWLTADYWAVSTLQQRGRRTDAAVVRTYSAGCGRSGCSVNVEYTFDAETPHGSRPGVRGDAYLAGPNYANDADYQSTLSTKSVPIVYDPDDPDRSVLNFHDRVFQVDQARATLRSFILIDGICALVMGTVALTLWLTTIGLKRRLGPDPLRPA